MAKLVQGSCNRCGHCGCYAGAGGPAKWYPGIPTSVLDWYLRYPDPQVQKFANWMINQIGYYMGYRGGGHFSIPGVGRVDYYISSSGIQKSETDTSCPFFELGTPNVCLLYGREEWPIPCSGYPQNFIDEARILAWERDHPSSPSGTCGYYWIDV